jgi:hypothetical protein
MTKKETQAVNKNMVVIKIDNQRCLVVERVEVPKYFINGIEFTEYDMRKLQSEVALGNVSHQILNEMNIVDEKGGKFNFREDGALTNSPYGYDRMRDYVLNIFKSKK